MMKNLEKMYDNFLEKVEENKMRLESGNYNCIPLPFPRMKYYIPGIQKSKNVIVTANSGVGKTQLVKFIYVYHAYLWCKKNKVPLKIFYFALEESKEEFIANAVCFFLKHEYNIDVDKDTILSMREVPISNYIMDKIKQLSPLMEDFLNVVDIQDNISNPTGIFLYLKEYAENNGVKHFKTITIEGEEKQVFDRYEQNNPEEYRIAITDHIGLLQPEQGMTLHQTLSYFSAEYGRKNLSKRYHYCFVIVQQQSAASEAKEYNNRGELNFSKLEPSLSDLGDNKYTQRDAHLVLGLFAPDRYEIVNYKGWSILKLQDNYRCIQVLKNRDGSSNLRGHLYFNGAVGKFCELPKINKDNTIDNLNSEKWYEEFKKNKEFWINNNNNLFSI